MAAEATVTTRIDQVVALAAELGAARAEVVRLEAELAALLGGGGERPRKEKPVGKVATAPAPDGKVGRGERRQQIVALWKEGVTDSGEIAKRLGITRKVAGIALWHARKDGDLPKAEKSR